MIITTNPPPINGIARKTGDVFGGGVAENSIRRSVGIISSAAYSVGSVDITSDNAAAVLAAIQSIDPNATTIEEVQTNASASTGAENQSWSDG
jgi:hypothetical protein